MRDPASNVSEQRRIRDAKDAARYELSRMFRSLDDDAAKYTIRLLICLLNDPDGDKLVRKYHPAPDTRDKLISFLQQVRPPRARRPGPDNTLRDSWLAYIIENIRNGGFDPHRGDTGARRLKDYPLKAAVRQSACSIAEAAWHELESEWHELESEVRENRKPRRRRFEPRLLKRPPKPLSESSLERIFDESEEGAQYRLGKSRGRRNTG